MNGFAVNRGVTLGLSAVALCAAAGGVAMAGDRSPVQVEREARDDAAKAAKALAKHDAEGAVRYAEFAVSLKPQDAAYRALLGQAYLASGRFASARVAFTDALALSPGEGRVALNLALAQIADGDWAGARQTLDSHSGSIAISDRGLAMALAGDPAGAVDLMLPVARQPGADAKLRQNLALSLALAGRWPDARLVAGMDLSPTEAAKRMEQWAAFARPSSHSDQVASLLGVTPSSDPGQPVALALNAATPVSVALVAPAVPAVTPVEAAKPVVTAPAAAVPASPVAAVPAIFAPRAGIVFGPRAEVVQPLPVRPGKAKFVKSSAAKPAVGQSAVAPVKASYVKPVVAKPTPGASTVSVGKGNYFVQLGAYDSAGIARDDWRRASRRFSGFSGRAPQATNFNLAGKSYYRLSVGGFDEAGAKRLCSSYRAHGGRCFVRTGAGEQAADWSKK